MLIAKHSSNNSIIIFNDIEDAVNQGYNAARIRESIRLGVTHKGYYFV